VSPRGLHRRVAVGEAVTWALLLTGMALKYSGVTEVGVQVFGLLHGVVFIAYCLVTVLLWVDQRWSVGRLVLGLAAAVPPFATIWFERYAARRGLLAESWRLRGAADAAPGPAGARRPHGLLEQLAARLLRHPRQGAAVGLVAVAGLTGVALLVGPPA
jgi:integral membrane protein